MTIIALPPLTSLADTDNDLCQGVIDVSRASVEAATGSTDYAVVPGWLVTHLISSPHQSNHIAAYVEDDAVVGYASLEASLSDTPTEAFIDVVVHPAHRRQGVGTQLLAWAEDLAASLGRTTLHGALFATPPAPADEVVTTPGGNAFPADSPGWQFVQAHGYALGQIQSNSVMDVPVPPDRLDAWSNETAAEGYRLHTWWVPLPDEWLGEYGRLRGDVTGETPNDGMDYEIENWSPDRLRARWREWQAAGLESLTVAAEHCETGRLVAFTQINLLGPHPAAAFQGYTYVERSHRGHHLGLAVKTQALRTLQESRPSVVRIHTENATENAPMLAINRQMGFYPDTISGFIQKKTS